MSTTEREYDVVVIGSGAGGLTTAALLCHQGYRTLVLEKLPFVGGRSATLPYKGHKLPTGVVIMSDEMHGSVCRAVGAEFALSKAKNFFTFRVDGNNYASPPSGIFKQMIGVCADNELEASAVYRAFLRALAWAEPSRAITLRDWVEQYTLNPKLIRFFDFWVAGITGLRDFELPAGEFFRFFNRYSYVKTPGFLPESGGSFTTALAKAIKRDGGDLWTRSRALAIEVEKGVARGVTARRGTAVVRVKSKVVVSNAGPWGTVDLAGRDNVGPGYAKEVDATRASVGIAVYVESDRPLLGDTELLCPIQSRRTVCLMADSEVSPELSPPGKHLLEIFGFVSSSASISASDFRSDVELCLMDARDNIPNFDKHARVLTAQLFHRKWGIMNAWPGHALPLQTPVEGLYAVGDANAPSGCWGSAAAVVSGRLAAEDIAKRWPAR